ncbi:MAG: DUF3336 domain-containing protein, partial [Chromatocurvus sp.]
MIQSRKLAQLERQMAKSETYDSWRELALEHDQRSGAQRWREVDQTRQYDYGQIRLRLDRLRSLRSSCASLRVWIIFYLNSCRR